MTRWITRMTVAILVASAITVFASLATVVDALTDDPLRHEFHHGHR